ncbi:MAG TPA: hypothetical protein VM533_01185 [Fimbriiglobus sp.]|nr:hypothetical protein [Fimbriiglobus sp.]
MTTSRFTFPVATPVPAFVAWPMAAGQMATVQQVYQVAWERTQAVLAPSPIEKLYRVTAN